MTGPSKHDILTNYSWIKVKKYEDDTKLSVDDRLARLEAHHKAETEFLINFIRDLVSGKLILHE